MDSKTSSEKMMDVIDKNGKVLSVGDFVVISNHGELDGRLSKVTAVDHWYEKITLCTVIDFPRTTSIMSFERAYHHLLMLDEKEVTFMLLGGTHA